MKSSNDQTATQIIEESVHVLKSVPLLIISKYLIGTIPFILYFLFFWGDMSHSSGMESYLAPFSLSLAILFIWMKVWQSIFMTEIKAFKANTKVLWSLKRVVKLILYQTIIQPTGLFLIHATGFLLYLPFPWIFAFYQNYSIDNNEPGIRGRIFSAYRLGCINPRQNIKILFIYSLFGFFVFLNVCSVLYFLPYLLSRILGIETLFSMSGFSFLNPSFLVISMGITYICVDPFIKTTYAIRCFYGSSMLTGEDLTAELKSFKQKSIVFAVILILFLIPISISSQTITHTPNELNESIEETLSQRKFKWKIPRPQEERVRTGMFDSFIDWIKPYFKSFEKTLKKWFESSSRKPRGSNRDVNSYTSSSQISYTKIFVILIIALLCIGLIFFIRNFKLKKKDIGAGENPLQSETPDLTDDYVDADNLKHDKWRELANKLIGEGSYRLALRALLLSILSNMSEKRFLHIARYKSNLDYGYELERRTHDNKDLNLLFRSFVKRFDRVWYGLHEISETDISIYVADQERILGFAEK
ncbi:MAG: hypothetical protein GY714_04175 [Desulfobacterales bacterium]|nr:hypothetical protein [Desulfobacterales bacterium]